MLKSSLAALTGLSVVAATPTAFALEWEEQIIGDTIPGWEVKNVSELVWTIADGVLTCTGERKTEGWFGTKEHFTDFAVDFEFKLPPGGNSGVFLRTSTSVYSPTNDLEIQLLDDYADKHKNLDRGQYCGAIYKFCPPSKRVSNPAGEWNHMRVTCLGPKIQVELNGEPVIDMDLDRWTALNQNPDGTPNKFPRAMKDFARQGYIGLQDHGRAVWYRNIRIKRLN